MAGDNDSKTGEAAMMVSHSPLLPPIAILGTGNFGRALGSLLSCRGVSYVFGSRKPSKDDVRDLVTDAQVLAIEEAIRQSRIVILAVPAGMYHTLPLQEFGSDHLVIDCSNRSISHRAKGPAVTTSNAEHLQSILPAGVPVVKAFNTLSAYGLESGGILQQQRQVPLASNSPQALATVIQLCQALGLSPLDSGTLASASADIEAIPFRLFPQWRAPLLVSVLLWIGIFINVVLSKAVCGKVDGVKQFIPWNWTEALDLLRHVNKTCDCHALWLLSLCYLPGCLAGYLQLIRGTKYSRFPGWLDRWLRMRKQFGLLMLLSASIHVCNYLLTYTRSKTNLTFPEPSFDNKTVDWGSKVEVLAGYTDMEVQDSLFLLAGIVAYALAVILGVSSLPSVTQSLSWREFRALQARFGWTCLFMATLHCLIQGLPSKFYAFDCIFPGTNQLPLWLPVPTILLKLPLALVFRWRLQRIRDGVDSKDQDSFFC